MSTFSTDQANRAQRETEQTLQDTQGSIVLHSAWAFDLAQEIQNLRTQVPLTTKELFDQRRVLAFKERQINEIRRALNRLESRAHALAQALGIAP